MLAGVCRVDRGNKKALVVVINGFCNTCDPSVCVRVVWLFTNSLNQHVQNTCKHTTNILIMSTINDQQNI